MDEDVFRKMSESFSSPEIQGCLSVVDSIVGYRLSAADRQPFLYFHNYLTNPQPEFITTWRSDPATEKWYQRFAKQVRRSPLTVQTEANSAWKGPRMYAVFHKGTDSPGRPGTDGLDPRSWRTACWH